MIMSPCIEALLLTIFVFSTTGAVFYSMFSLHYNIIHLQIAIPFILISLASIYFLILHQCPKCNYKGVKV